MEQHPNVGAGGDGRSRRKPADQGHCLTRPFLEGKTWWKRKGGRVAAVANGRRLSNGTGPSTPKGTSARIKTPEMAPLARLYKGGGGRVSVESTVSCPCEAEFSSAADRVSSRILRKTSEEDRRGRGGRAVNVLTSHQGESGSICPSGSLPDFRMWESCRTIPMVDGFSRGSPVSLAPYSPQITLIGSKDLSVKGRPNLFTSLDDLLSMIYMSSTALPPLTSWRPGRSAGLPIWPRRPWLQFRLTSVYIALYGRVLLQCLSPAGLFAAAGATVADRLACSPPTKAIRVQSPAGSLRNFACGNRAGRCRWLAGFLGDLLSPLPLHSGAAPFSPQSPSSALKTSMLRAVQISSLFEQLTMSIMTSPSTRRCRETCTLLVVEVCCSFIPCGVWCLSPRGSHRALQTEGGKGEKLTRGRYYPSGRVGTGSDKRGRAGGNGGRVAGKRNEKEGGEGRRELTRGAFSFQRSSVALPCLRSCSETRLIHQLQTRRRNVRRRRRSRKRGFFYPRRNSTLLPTGLPVPRIRDDKIDFKRVYTEVVCAIIGSEFIRHTLDDSAPIADLQGSKRRIPYSQIGRSDKGDSVLGIKHAIATKRKAMNRHAVFSSHCVSLPEMDTNWRHPLTWETDHPIPYPAPHPLGALSTTRALPQATTNHSTSLKGWENPSANHNTRPGGEERTTRLPPWRTGLDSRRGGPQDFRMWESCWTVALIGGFSRGSPVSSTAPYSRRPTLIGSRAFDVRSRPNISTIAGLTTIRFIRQSPVRRSRDIQPIREEVAPRAAGRGEDASADAVAPAIVQKLTFSPAAKGNNGTCPGKGIKTALSRAPRLRRGESERITPRTCPKCWTDVDQHTLGACSYMLSTNGCAKITVYDKERDAFLELMDLDKQTGSKYIGRILYAINDCFKEEEVNAEDEKEEEAIIMGTEIDIGYPYYYSRKI
ncbi:hypothetical protein PR048_032510 [Dryococelus australis]|uniref:Uncharacterized protein n=1 Tax=Dryococelus australis TaxID=614101 RepID=A0ABQ9G2E2_9NEOP|nr:hypothetical protein PR048_032510 [Dryococelus australis]